MTAVRLVEVWKVETLVIEFFDGCSDELRHAKLDGEIIQVRLVSMVDKSILTGEGRFCFWFCERIY